MTGEAKLMAEALVGWQPIDSDTPQIERCLLWCSDIDPDRTPIGVCMGRICRYSDGTVMPRGHGYHGDWNYSHWMAFPPPPGADA